MSSMVIDGACSSGQYGSAHDWDELKRSLDRR
jgi:hypothetical protein